MPAFKPIEERFKEKYIVNAETGCWDWQASKMGGGYGVISLPRSTKNVVAHRLSYEMSMGEIPTGMIVCHKCDNPGCVNPEHLYLGTHDDNMADLARKGRARTLTEEQARQVVADIEYGLSQAAVARKLGVTHSTIQRTLKLAAKGDFGGIAVGTNHQKYVRVTDDMMIDIILRLQAEEPIIRIAERHDIDRKTVRNIRDKMASRREPSGPNETSDESRFH